MIETTVYSLRLPTMLKVIGLETAASFSSSDNPPLWRTHDLSALP